MRRSCVIAVWALVMACATAQAVNPNYLRRDETLGYDEIALRSSATCKPSADSRVLGLGVNEIRFLDATYFPVARIDVGTAAGAYYLGEGWHQIETWNPTLKMQWTNGLVAQSTVYFPIPATATMLEIVGTTPCVAMTTTVLLNGQRLGQFSLSADSGFQTNRLALPREIPRHLDYRLIEGGQLSVASIDWLGGDGRVAVSTPSAAELKAGQTATFSAPRLSSVGDFCVHLARPAPAPARLLVSVNNASALIVPVAAGEVDACSEEKDALERQADRRRKDQGWGEDFNARNAFTAFIWPGLQYPEVKSDGDTVEAALPITGQADLNLVLQLPEALPISEYPYLSVKLRVTKGATYFIRPAGLDRKGTEVNLWYEEAVTDDRPGTGEWETLTINLTKLVRLAGTGATHMAVLRLNMVRPPGAKASMTVDWVTVHKSFRPNSEDLNARETDFTNHLDDDGDGLTDKDDEADRLGMGFGQRLVLSYYYPWFGTPSGPSRRWWWNGQKEDFSNPDAAPVPLGIRIDPDTYDPAWPGKRNLVSGFYPLNFRSFPDYVPPADGRNRYDLHGGVDRYDSLDITLVRDHILLAQRYGLDGFLTEIGGGDYLRVRSQLVLAAAETVPELFRISVVYDNFYRLPLFRLFEEKPEHSMAGELIDLYRFMAASPRWLRYDGRPVITAPFLSYLISPEKWRRVADVATNPSLSAFDGAVIPWTPRPGFGNRMVFQFERAEQPGLDQRYLSVTFDYIAFLDRDFNEVGRFDFGTPAARPHLLNGWSNDEVSPDGATWVWAHGTQREAAIEAEIPATAQFFRIVCSSFTPTNTVTLRVNDGAPLTFTATQAPRPYTFRLGAPAEAGSRSERPFALFLDSPEASASFDGFLSYGSYLRNTVPLVSDDRPVLFTVACGYDDRKIRYPGNLTDRENGAYYRRQWETALAGEPDVVVINTWNEWAESTNIEPSVEFGYKYLELTLTYSLILHGRLAVSPRPSEIDFTVLQYQVDPERSADIRFRAARAGEIVLKDLPRDLLARCSITRNGQPFPGYSVNLGERTLTLRTSEGLSEYRLLVRAPLSIISVVNAASYRSSRIVPGALVSIFVSGFTTQSALAASLPLPVELAGASVLFNGIAAPLVYAGPGQINAQVPWELTGSSASVVVRAGGTMSPVVSVRLAPADPGIFTLDSSGLGAGILTDALSGALITFTQPIRRGQYATLYGTGFGPVSPAPASGAAPEGLAHTATVPEVRVGGLPARVLFSGLAPGFVGLNQINIEIPREAPVGTTVPLTVSVGSATSNPVTLAIQ